AHSLAAALASLTGAEANAGPRQINELVDAATAMVGPGRIERLVESAVEMGDPAYWQAATMAAQKSLLGYVDVYTTMGWVTVGIGVFLVLISRPLNKMMHGVK